MPVNTRPVAPCTLHFITVKRPYETSLHYNVYVCLSVCVQFLGVYSISKTALLGATKVLSSELVQDGIRVNCLAPGLIKTKFSSAVSYHVDVRLRGVGVW